MVVMRNIGRRYNLIRMLERVEDALRKQGINSVPYKIEDRGLDNRAVYLLGERERISGELRRRVF